MGRRLASATRSNGSKVTYTYNADGLLTSKTVGIYKLDYFWDGDKLTCQTDGVNTWYFRYDGDTPIGLEFNGIEYYYVTNLQGDVIAILNDSGECVAEYEYDAWGNCTVIKDTNTIAYDNPLRYRGYYYDAHLKLYYLQSRFYDANTGRFINADAPEMIEQGETNLFSYCVNNPVMNIDPTGLGKNKKSGKTCVIYYYASKGTLDHFAKNSAYFSFYSSNVETHCVYSARQFVECWNNLSGNIENIYLYLHGDPGQLNFQKGYDNLGFSKGGNYNKYYSLYSLGKKTINNAIYLFSCYGGKSVKGNKSVARFFHERNKCTVVACNGGVNYVSSNKKYYASSSYNPKKFGRWVSFYYEKRFIYFGSVISKLKAGPHGILYL